VEPQQRQRIALATANRGQRVCAIDPDAFGILLRNLIENALKYGAADQPVEVSLTDQALLRVVNGGPAVPAPVLQRLTERFVRGSSEASGTGLGLAIAKTIVQGVKARMTLASPATGRDDGFEVNVQFLRCRPERSSPQRCQSEIQGHAGIQRAPVTG
jgi:two-component system OmpR family sensor kinase